MRDYLSTTLITLIVGVILSVSNAVNAQTIVAVVNDDPITSLDVAQRQRWIGRTSGFGDRMKAALTSDAIKQKFREMMVAANPRSQAEAQQVSEKIKKQLIENTKQRVLGEGASKKVVLDAIIEDKLKLQAAKKLGITVPDSEVEENLSLRASGGKSGKVNLTEFYAQFENDGIGRKTIQNIVRAQIAWREVIRRQFGPQIASIVAASTTPAKKEEPDDVRFDLRVLRLAVSGAGEEGKRVIEAENLRQKFSSCKDLPKQATLISNASVKTMDKTKLESLPADIQPYIRQASEGQMTPPIVVSGAVESYAVCKKTSASKAAPKADDKPDARQLEYERFSKRYLQKIRDEATIDNRVS